MKAAGMAIECGKLLSWKPARQDSPWSLSSSFPEGRRRWGTAPPPRPCRPATWQPCRFTSIVAAVHFPPAPLYFIFSLIRVIVQLLEIFILTFLIIFFFFLSKLPV